MCEAVNLLPMHCMACKLEKAIPIFIDAIKVMVKRAVF